MSKLSEFLKDHGACEGGVDWVKENKIKTLAEAWDKCPRGDWMIWMLGKSGKVAADKTVWARIACPVARRALPIFEKWNATDKRPHEAIAARERWIADPTDANEQECQAWAAGAARAAEAAWAAELQAQADDLRKMFPTWSKIGKGIV